MKKTISIVLCLILIAGSLSGCNNSYKDISFSSKKYDIRMINSDVLQGNTAFAFEIFKEINKEDKEESIFISPFSISIALSMTYQGANGTTKDGMTKALNYENINIDTIKDTYKNHLRYLNQVDNKIKLDINNSIWIKEGKEIKEDFLSVNKEVFEAYIKSLDFSKEQAVEEINSWIKNATNGKISKMLNPPIPHQVVMYLINAIYFKGEWTKEFDERNTFSSEFDAGDGSSQQVMMMNKNDEVEYGEGMDFKAVRLPYGNEKTALYCILPKKNISINDFIATMDLRKWNEIKESIEKREEVILQIPRFKLEYGVKNLNDSLINLGMGEAFSSKADFSGISDGIAISRVLHKAVIEVNEKGSEAAGVTVVEMNESANIEEPLSFIGDRPFLFIIEENETDTILFLGKLFKIQQ